MARWAMLLLITAACASRPPQGTADLEAIYLARSDSARMRFTPADARFMSGMIPHHTQALVMAEMARSRAAGPAIQTLAARIINAQQDEIATMEAWLRERGLPVPEAGGHTHVRMPGMLTPEQLARLDAARGPEFDRLFLQFMIQHHRGAVVMVHELFGTDGAGQDDVVFKLASDIQVDQITEIARMERMLEEMNPS